jgi:hypothetical protein
MFAWRLIKWMFPITHNLTLTTATKLGPSTCRKLRIFHHAADPNMALTNSSSPTSSRATVTALCTKPSSEPPIPQTIKFSGGAMKPGGHVSIILRSRPPSPYPHAHVPKTAITYSSTSSVTSIKDGSVCHSCHEEHYDTVYGKCDRLVRWIQDKGNRWQRKLRRIGTGSRV